MQELLTAREKGRGWWLVSLFAVLVVGSWFFPGSALDGIVWCPFRRLTGFLCPGCGMTRACVALVHGRVFESFCAHAFGPGLMLGLGIAAGHCLIQNVQGRRVNWWGMRLWRRHERVFWRVLLGMFLVYSALRFVVWW